MSSMSKSYLEDKFQEKWENFYPDIPLLRDYKLLEHRRFKADFVHLQSKTAIEIQGGVWVGGRHNRGLGYINDCKRMLELISNGWTVIYLVKEMFNEEFLEKIAGVIRHGNKSRYRRSVRKPSVHSLKKTRK